MGHHCCHVEPPPPTRDDAFRRVLWIALIANAGMFAGEIVAGLSAGSLALLADAMDFLGDTANYGVSLFVLSLGLAWRARAALLKGASMAVFGVWVLSQVVWGAIHGTPPDHVVMGVVGLLALAVNFGVAVLLYKFRVGDANMRSVWLCTRNDAIGNLAVLGAASGVFATGTMWPDLAVAAVMAGLALQSAASVIRQARQELRAPAVAPAAGNR